MDTNKSLFRIAIKSIFPGNNTWVTIMLVQAPDKETAEILAKTKLMKAEPDILSFCITTSQEYTLSEVSIVANYMR